MEGVERKHSELPRWLETMKLSWPLGIILQVWKSLGKFWKVLEWNPWAPERTDLLPRALRMTNFPDCLNFAGSREWSRAILIRNSRDPAKFQQSAEIFCPPLNSPTTAMWITYVGPDLVETCKTIFLSSNGLTIPVGMKLRPTLSQHGILISTDYSMSCADRYFVFSLFDVTKFDFDSSCFGISQWWGILIGKDEKLESEWEIDSSRIMRSGPMDVNIAWTPSSPTFALFFAVFWLKKLQYGVGWWVVYLEWWARTRRLVGCSKRPLWWWQ